MATSLNIALTDELRAFIASQCGEGTMYATPTEYVRDLIRRQQEREEARHLREGILEGFHDAIEGRTIEFSGDLRRDLNVFKKQS